MAASIPERNATNLVLHVKKAKPATLSHASVASAGSVQRLSVGGESLVSVPRLSAWLLVLASIDVIQPGRRGYVSLIVLFVPIFLVSASTARTVGMES